MLDALLKAQKDGKLSGIHGRLGNLGSIEDKYDVAITTACGALNHIVVSNVTDAQVSMHFYYGMDLS